MIGSTTPAGPHSPTRSPALPFHLQLPNPVIADLVDRLDEAGRLALRSLALLADMAPAAAELDRRAAELEHQVRALRDLVAPVAVRCTDQAGG